MYYDVSSFRYMMQEKMYSLRGSRTNLPHPFYMTTVAPLAEGVHFARGVGSPRSKKSKYRYRQKSLNPPRDGHSFLRFRVDQVTK